MAALELLSQSMGIDPRSFSKEESQVLEAELYSRISYEIWEDYKAQNKDYFYLVKYDIEKENLVMEMQVIRKLMSDIINSEDYTLSGIAYYTQTPEEIVQELLIGGEVNPLLLFARKLIELHKLTRPDLYRDVIKKLKIHELEAERVR